MISQPISLFHTRLQNPEVDGNVFWRSVKADYCGYTDANNVRHEALSISASRKHWKEECKKNIEKIERELSTAEKNAIQNQIDDLVLIYRNDSTNFGALHNAAVLTILLEDEMAFSNTEELASSTLNSLKKLGLNISGVSEKDVANDIDMFFDEIYSDDTNIMFNRLSARYPERKAELSILEDYITTVQDFESIDDIENFTNGYISIINNSQIKSCDKEKLSSNISIAPASRQLWEEIDALSL